MPRYNYNHKILITGCGCSGTEFITKFLSKAGLPLGHDAYMGKYGIASWGLAAQTDDVLWGPKYSSYKFRPILHQVRFPLNCISSIRLFSLESWEYIEKNISIKKSDSPLLNSMKYWHLWNKKAEKISAWTYKIEDLKENLEQFCDEIGYPELWSKNGSRAVDLMEILEKTPKKVGSRWRYLVNKFNKPIKYGKHHSRSSKDRWVETDTIERYNNLFKKKLTWEDLHKEDASLTEKIKNQAKQYGYEI